MRTDKGLSLFKASYLLNAPAWTPKIKKTPRGLLGHKRGELICEHRDVYKRNSSTSSHA